jgi:hypothetical protein
MKSFFEQKCAYFEEIFQAKSEKAWKRITSLERERFDKVHELFSLFTASFMQEYC